MRIPSNSTVTKELSKRFNRIFKPTTTLSEIKNLQEKLNNPVNTYLLKDKNKQVSKFRRQYGYKKTPKVAETIRQEHYKRERIVPEIDCNKREKKEIGLVITRD